VRPRPRDDPGEHTDDRGARGLRDCDARRSLASVSTLMKRGVAEHDGGDKLVRSRRAIRAAP
jgi:hypothetical protein